MDSSGGTIKLTDTVKYLGVSLTSGCDYMATQEKAKWVEAARSKGMLGCQSLWSFNRYE